MIQFTWEQFFWCKWVAMDAYALAPCGVLDDVIWMLLETGYDLALKDGA